MLADKTFWVESEEAGRMVFRAVTSDDPVEDLFADTGVLGVPVRKHSPCKDCQVLDICMGSVWKDGRRMGGPSLYTAQLTEVFPCRTCGRMALQPLVFSTVSERCPRGDVIYSALDCRRCDDRKDALPRTPPEANPLARRLLGALLHDWATRFPKVWGRVPLEEWQGAWEGCLRRGLADHPTQPDQILLEVLLDVTERPGLADLWIVMGVKERVFLRRVWEGLIWGVLRDVA